MLARVLQSTAVGALVVALLPAGASAKPVAPKPGQFSGTVTNGGKLVIDVSPKGTSITGIEAFTPLYCTASDGTVQHGSVESVLYTSLHVPIKRSAAGYTFTISKPSDKIVVKGTFSRNGRKLTGTVSAPTGVWPTDTSEPCGTAASADGVLSNAPAAYSATLTGD